MTYKNKKTNSVIILKESLKPKDVLEDYQDWVNVSDCKTLDNHILEFGEEFFIIDKRNFKIYKASFGMTFQNSQRWDLRFKERHNADWWVIENKRIYNLSDIKKVVNNWSISNIDFDNILNFFKE